MVITQNIPVILRVAQFLMMVAPSELKAALVMMKVNQSVTMAAAS